MFRFHSAQASIHHIWAVARKEVNHIVRDRSTLFLVLFTPTLVLLLMAYALTVDLKHIPVAVLDLDRSQTSQAFIQQITAGQDLDIYAYATRMDEINRMLLRGEIKAAIIIAPGFASDLQALRGIPCASHHRWDRAGGRQLRGGTYRATRRGIHRRGTDDTTALAGYLR